MPCEIGNVTATIEAIMIMALFKIYREDCDTHMIEMPARPNKKQPQHINFFRLLANSLQESTLSSLPLSFP